MPVIPPQQAPATLLHRIRFLDHTPSPITALTFAPLPLPPSIKGKEKATSEKEELGVLVVARENGEIELWEWERGDEDRSIGNWVLRKVGPAVKLEITVVCILLSFSQTLPPTLTHPTISLISLVIRDPTSLHLKNYAVPKIADLRLFTAGSDSSDLTERCLLTGRVLVSFWFLPARFN